MDRDNLEYLIAEAAVENHDKIQLFLDYSVTKRGGEVPDPYYGGPTGFERVLDLIEDATEGFIDELLKGDALSS